MPLLSFLIDKTKAERGYSSTGTLLTRIIRSLSEIYTLNNRFVNSDEWDSPGKLWKQNSCAFTPKSCQNSTEIIAFIGDGYMRPRMSRSSGTVCVVFASVVVAQINMFGYSTVKRRNRPPPRYSRRHWFSFTWQDRKSHRDCWKVGQLSQKRFLQVGPCLLK